MGACCSSDPLPISVPLRGRGTTFLVRSFVSSVGRDLPPVPKQVVLPSPGGVEDSSVALRTAQPLPQMDRPQRQDDATPPPGKALSLGGESPVAGPQARACGLPWRRSEPQRQQKASVPDEGVGPAVSAPPSPPRHRRGPELTS
ncbi:hypothetical protein NDU88_002118 [Pleurodeles waltl]|uniref:Uncharacterized protein n=1 Tax=Pleurodeles waltl TaxID=8319 RepID=A0AAV7TK89_PLEWA|nr:hypothetical protein NDU88_002118 [Pleurodeles waltl]